MSWSFMVMRARGIIALCAAPGVALYGDVRAGRPPLGLCGFFGALPVQRRIGIPPRRTVLYRDRGVESAADVETGAETHVARPRKRHQFIEDFVADRLVKRAAVAERVQVQFQRLQFHAYGVRNVVDRELREVRLAGLRAQAGELGRAHPDGIIAARARVRESLQDGVHGRGIYTTCPAFENRSQCALTRSAWPVSSPSRTPVNIAVPTKSLAVVGPNGCGKSNIIDAVRWVLGEISARQLRSGAMAEVIFNGSSRRTALGAATVELLFDNTEPGPGSRFADYSEITVRRTVRRDGISEYFLNNSRCRRKDITQMFAGTGLGIGGYAIIEQSMINLLVEGRPDELRAYLEEAAGVSGYRQRRRETTLRIARTRENLERLAERRAELGSSLRRLKRQASAAGRYRKNLSEKRKVQAQRLALDIRDLDRLLEQKKIDASTRETQLARVEAEYRGLEARMLSAREQQTEAQAAFDEANRAYYELQAEIAGLEDTVGTQQALGRERESELTQLAERLEELRAELKAEAGARERRKRMLAELEPELKAAREEEANRRAQSEQAVDRRSRWEADRHAAEMRLQSLRQEREILLRERLAGLVSLQEAARRRSGRTGR